MLCYLAFHGISVDLTHVGARVIGLDVADVEFPCVMIVVGDGEAWVQCYHVCVDRQNCLRIRLYPRHLGKTYVYRDFYMTFAVSSFNQ